MDLQGRKPVIHLDHPWPVTLPQDAQGNLQSFKRGEPVILGVSQIMLGLMSICLWVMLKVSFISHQHAPFLLRRTVLPYFFLLGPIFYIMAGTLSIVSGKKMTKNMICSSLGMNTLSTVLAGASIIITALTLTNSLWVSEGVVKNLLSGIMIVKLILTVLELFIALTLCAFGCQAVCCEETSVVVDLSSKELELSMRALHHDYDEVAFPST